MKEIVFKKIKLSKKNLVKDDPLSKNSYRISIQKYVSITLKGMGLSEISKKRKTEPRYGPSGLIYNKKDEKKEGKFFYKLVSYYKGELKNGKANGWGVEVLKYQPDRIVNPTYYPNHEVVQYYEGEWKDGRRNGYGECYDHHPLLGTAQQFEVDGLPIQMTVFQDETGFYSGGSYKGNWKNGIKEGNGIESSNNKKETGIFKNEKLWTGTSEDLKFTDYQRKIKTYRNGKEISQDTIKSDDFTRVRETMFNMNKILLDSIISIFPAKFKSRMDKNNYFIHECDSVEENRKVYNYKNNKVYCHYSLDAKDFFGEPIDKPSKIISLSFLKFIKGYKVADLPDKGSLSNKKKLSKKNFRLLMMTLSSTCNDFYHLIGVGYFKEDNEICKFLQLNRHKYEKIADKKFKKQRLNRD